MKVGDKVAYAYCWAHGRDFGDGVIEGLGNGWVTIREEFYGTVVMYTGAFELLRPHIKKGKK